METGNLGIRGNMIIESFDTGVVALFDTYGG